MAFEFSQSQYFKWIHTLILSPKYKFICLCLLGMHLYPSNSNERNTFAHCQTFFVIEFFYDTHYHKNECSYFVRYFMMKIENLFRTMNVCSILWRHGFSIFYMPLTSTEQWICPHTDIENHKIERFKLNWQLHRHLLMM